MVLLTLILTSSITSLLYVFLLFNKHLRSFLFQSSTVKPHANWDQLSLPMTQRQLMLASISYHSAVMTQLESSASTNWNVCWDSSLTVQVAAS